MTKESKKESKPSPLTAGHYTPRQRNRHDNPVARPQGIPKGLGKAVRYTEGVGRRKTAVARVRIISGKGTIAVNEKPVERYFPPAHLQKIVRAPLEAVRLTSTYDVHASVRGGGIHAQAEAVRHGLARALVRVGEEFKKPLRSFGYLTRDPRMVERKKYGLKKARRAPQWQKR